jgi:putative ABC transport system substrate-binding protein
MRRRDFITLLGGAAACPLAARAQQAALPVVGWLNSGWSDQHVDRLRGFRQGLGEAGFVEGRNVAIEYRWAQDQYDRLPGLAADLVRRRVGLIAANSPIVAQAARGATATIPIVFNIGSDPVTEGLVASLNHPGGNATGIAYLAVELGPKLLELLHEVVPVPSVALLVNPNNPTLAEPTTKDLQVAARRLGLDLHVLYASSENDFDVAFTQLGQLNAGALVIGPDPIFSTRLAQLAALTLRHGVPAIYLDRVFADAGGLMTYGPNIPEMWRKVGTYAGRILKGEKPADLPVELPTKFDFVINLRTARALGLTIAPIFQTTADEIIE